MKSLSEINREIGALGLQNKFNFFYWFFKRKSNSLEGDLRALQEAYEATLLVAHYFYVK